MEKPEKKIYDDKFLTLSDLDRFRGLQGTFVLASSDDLDFYLAKLEKIIKKKKLNHPVYYASCCHTILVDRGIKRQILKHKRPETPEKITDLIFSEKGLDKVLYIDLCRKHGFFHQGSVMILKYNMPCFEEAP